MTWMLQWLVQGVAVAAVATVAVRVVPANSPRHRHLVWWLALAGVLALPWLPALMASIATPTMDAAPGTLAVHVARPPAWIWTTVRALWTGSVAVGLASLVADLIAVRTLKRSTRPLPWTDPRVADELQISAAAVRGTQLAVSDELTGACAVGFRAPRVIVSSRLVSSLEPAALESIVRHELAHLERFDDWLRLLQRLVLALAGLHPAVRWISRQIDIEREAACDRLVVERTGNPVVYARALTAVAELTAGVRGAAPGLVPGASVSGAGLHARVVRLLLGQASRPGRVRAAAVASVAVLTLAVTGLAGLPPLVVMASLEPSLRALASLPAGRAFVPYVPLVQARFVAEPLVTGPGEIAPVLETSASRESPSARTVEDAVLPEPEVRPVVAAAETLDVPVRREIRLGETASVAASSPFMDGIAARASRAGRVTGSTTARAGTAVGRFFSKGGQAVAGAAEALLSEKR